MEERKRKEPEEEKGKEKEICPQPPLKRKRMARPPVKTLREIAKQKFIEVLPEVENYSEILESIPAEEVKEEIKQNRVSGWIRQSGFEETLLHRAQSAEDIDKGLAFGFDPNTKDRRGRTALNALIEKGNLDAAFHLVTAKEKSLDVHSPDNSGITPLQNAIEHEDEQLAKNIFKILKQSPRVILDDIDSFNSTNWSAFTLAIRYMPKLAKKFLKKGAHIYETNKYGEKPIMFAAKYTPSLIKPLIDTSLSFDDEELGNKKNKNGKTPLMYAAESNPDSTEILLQYDKILKHINEQDKEGKTALMYAAASNIKAVESLIGAGADINIEDKEGNTALYYAIEKSNLNAITLLIDAGVDPNQDSLEAVKKLLELGADPNGENNEGLNALTMAINHNQPEIVKVLLEHGAKVTDQSIEKAQSNVEIFNLITQNFASTKD
jgi:ankyrin repeat protein